MSAGISSRYSGWPSDGCVADDPDFRELVLEHRQFRAGLVRALRDRGYRIVVAACDDDHRPKLADLGAAFVPLPINSSGISVVEDCGSRRATSRLCGS